MDWRDLLRKIKAELYSVKMKKQDLIDIHIDKSATAHLQKHATCLFIVTIVIAPGESPEKKQKAMDEYISHREKGDEVELINKDDGFRLYSKDGDETRTKLYKNLIKFAADPKKAYIIWNRIDELMENQIKTKAICRPIKAAMDVKAISRPAFQDFIKDFERFKSIVDRSTFNLCLTDKDQYKLDPIFDEYKKQFIELNKK